MFQQPRNSALYAEVINFIDLMKAEILPQYRTVMQNQPMSAETMVLTSIVRSNLECDLAQRGGTLSNEVIVDPPDIPSVPLSKLDFRE